KISKLNKDVLFLIFYELQSDRRSLHSCLLVNRTWCETTVPILWKNPWLSLECEETKSQTKSQFNVIISHLSNETKENLRNQGVNLPEILQKPFFNYIRFYRYLKLDDLENLIFNNVETSKAYIVMDEILKLF